jgi:glycosyltransferase involved in cell wall biosynthesis
MAFFKICHLSSGHPVEIRIFYKECMSLKKAGYDVTLIALHECDEIMNGIKIRSLVQQDSLFKRATKTVCEVYRLAARENADVYHFHDPELITCGLLLKLRGKMVIYDVHENFPRRIMSRSGIPNALKPSLSSCFEALENFAARRFDAVVAATPSIGERFTKKNVRTIVINNYPITSELFTPNTNWTMKERAVCYVGGIAAKRGLYETLDALCICDITLLFAGWFSSEREERAAAAHPGWRKVTSYGRVARDRVRHVLSRSIAGLVLFHPEPNHINSQPNKMFEYMSAGIPVVASDFPLWREIVNGSGCGLLVDPLDTRAIASAITWLLDHPAEAEQMGKNGQMAVRDRFNWESESVKLISFYEQILDPT